MELSPNILAVLVLGYLRKYGRCRAAAWTQPRIAADLRGLGLAVTVRSVRDAASALVLDGLPVGTSSAKPGGVFLCTDRADFEAGYSNLVVRVRAQAARTRRFAQTAREALSGQRTFDFGEAAPRLCLSHGARALGGERR